VKIALYKAIFKIHVTQLSLGLIRVLKKVEISTFKFRPSRVAYYGLSTATRISWLFRLSVYIQVIIISLYAVL
jgi:hypothetical protein